MWKESQLQVWFYKYTEIWKYVTQINSDFTGLIDSHCHIDFIYSRMIPTTVPSTFQGFVTRFHREFPKCFEGCIAVFCEPEKWERVSYLNSKLFKWQQNYEICFISSLTQIPFWRMMTLYGIHLEFIHITLPTLLSTLMSCWKYFWSCLKL